MDDRYCTVFTKEFESMKSRIAELEARWEKLRNYVETMKTANQCGALAAWGTCRAMLEKMTELERTKQRTGLNES